MRVFITFTTHIQRSPEIWFETEHFEILSFRASGSVSGLFTYWAWNQSREQIKWNFKIWKVYMRSTRRDEQNPEIVSKTEDFGFSAKFLLKLNFCKNRGKFFLTQWKKVVINSLRDIKTCNFSMKPWPSPSPMNLLPPQTDGTEFQLPVVPESVSW